MNSLEQAEGRVCRPPGPEAEGGSRGRRDGAAAGGTGRTAAQSAAFSRLGLGALLIDEPFRGVECEFIFVLSDNPTSRKPNFLLGLW